MDIDLVIQDNNSSLGTYDITMGAVNPKMMNGLNPKCMCKSKRGRKMEMILSETVYFRQFLTGTWVQMKKILGWECYNCNQAQLHERVALISKGGAEAVAKRVTNEGLVINRGRAEDIMYEDIGLVPDELKHLIPDDWTEGHGQLLPNPDLPEVA